MHFILNLSNENPWGHWVVRVNSKVKARSEAGHLFARAERWDELAPSIRPDLINRGKKERGRDCRVRTPSDAAARARSRNCDKRQKLLPTMRATPMST